MSIELNVTRTESNASSCEGLHEDFEKLSSDIKKMISDNMPISNFKYASLKDRIRVFVEHDATHDQEIINMLEALSHLEIFRTGVTDKS